MINNNNYALDIIATFLNPYIYMIDINCMLVINHLDSAVTNTYMCHFIIVTLNKNLYVVIEKCFFHLLYHNKN